MRYAKAILIILAILAAAGRVHLQGSIPDATPPPCLGSFATHAEAEEFLRTARIVDSAGISRGVTLPQKVTLEKDGRREFGVFKSIDIRKPGITLLPGGPVMNFRDSWKHEIGAYELDKLLGLNMIPPTVERYYGKKKGSLQLWIHDCFTEEERIRKKMSPPNMLRWEDQIANKRVFDNLIYNFDRNQGNILIYSDWSMILIDHSRAFMVVDDLPGKEDLGSISASLAEALKKLDEKDIKKHAGKYLALNEIRAVLHRRDRILSINSRARGTSDPVQP